jgi:hypothetical protein
MTLAAMGVAAYGASAMVLSTSGQLPSMPHHYPDRVIAAALHFGVGGLVLLIGPFQFLPGLRSRRPVLHRWTGRVYVAGCLASGIAALIMSPYVHTGTVARVGFTLLALGWLITTSIAFGMALNRRFAGHRRWMVRSYALTLAAVSLRLLLPSTSALGIPFEEAYPVIAYACWVPNVIIAEWWLRRPGT